MRLIKQLIRVTPSLDVRRAVVYYHADWKDFFVRFYLNGVVIHKATYPADSREDAISKADWFVNLP